MTRFARWTVRRPRRIAVMFVAVAAATALAIWAFQPEASAESALPVVEATTGEIVLAVGGVGRVVPADSSEASGAAGSTATPASVNASGVFPRTSGQLATFLVKRGKQVRAGQPVALLTDGGAAAAAVRVARIELQTAQLELLQRRTSDPATGTPPTPQEFAAAAAAVDAAEARLKRLGNPTAADVSAARLDVKRAESDLEALKGGTSTARAEAIRIAKRNVELAQNKLNTLLGPPNDADLQVAVAELRKAEADLAIMLKARPARPEAIAAANAAIVAARNKLQQLIGSGETDFVVLTSAQAELNRAIAELAALQNPPPALAEELASAQQAIEAARAKVARLLGPPNPADVSAARLELERAQAELRARQNGPSRASLEAGEAAVTAARARLQALLDPNGIDMTTARLDVRRAEADLAVLRGRGRPGSPLDIQLAQLRVDAAEARLAAAQHTRRLLIVRSPTAGVVASLLAARGAPVDPLTPIAAVTNLRNVAVSVQLSEFDAASVKRGLEAVVSVDALGGQEFAGEVLFAGLAGNDNGGIVTFPVRVGVDHARGLRPGMNVSVEIIVDERQDVLQVPLEAITTDDEDNNTVTVIDENGNTSTRTVSLGLANNQVVEITKGLKKGERVVLPAAEEGGGEEE